MPVPVISIAQMREWEKATWAAGQTETEVIRRVGTAVAQHALKLTHPGGLILILAGKGHNGDDARQAQPRLEQRRVELLDVTEPAADFQKLESLLAAGPALIIDGLFGIGLNRPLAPEWARFIERLNAAHLPVLAVDVPSGLNAESGEAMGAAVQATNTLTVGAPKAGLLQPSAWPFVGRLEVAADIGLGPCPASSEVNWTLPTDFAGFPPARPVATNKGSYGHLALLAGSLGFHGAAVLAARGAQRAQPGLITLHALESIYGFVAPQLQAVMVAPWDYRERFAERYSAILLGPGLAGKDVPEELKGLVRQLWLKSSLPIVADASALDWLPQETIPGNPLRVVTPHPGEAARLLRSTPQKVQASRLEALRGVSRRLSNAWVVLKGHQTLIGRSAGEVFVNPSGNPYLAQGGSGDVLAGFIAGFLAQPALRPEPLRAIRYAVWRHGAAADFLQSARVGWVVEDLVEGLGAAR